MREFYKLLKEIINGLFSPVIRQKLLLNDKNRQVAYLLVGLHTFLNITVVMHIIGYVRFL